MQRGYSLGVAAAILSSVLSSFAWIFQGESVRLLTPLVTACFINLLSAVVLFTFLALTRSLPKLSQVQTHWKDFLTTTLLRSIIASVGYSFALSMTDGLKLMFFTKLEPYFVLCLAWIFENHRVHPRQLILLLAHVVGAIMLSTNGEFAFSEAQLGDLLVILCVGLVSLTYASSSRLSRAVGAIKVNMLSMAVSGFVILPFVFLFHPPQFAELPSAGWANLLITLLLFQVFGLSLWYYSLQNIHGWLSSALRASGPVLAAPFAYFLFGQALSTFQILGALLVLLTSAMIARESRPKE